MSETTSNADGEFAFAAARSAVDLGVVANGFLRSLVRDAWDTQPADGHRIVLTRGVRVMGRVVDRDGMPVAGLELLAHSADAAKIAHVSPSSSRRRARRAELADAASIYHQCLRRTDAMGVVEFTGLIDHGVNVRSFDPEWTIETPSRVSPSDVFVEWTARRRLGVHVDVVAAGSGAPVPLVFGTFRVELGFDDGTNEDVGQWVGSGFGELSLTLRDDMLPDYGGRRITSARFYGEARDDTTRAEWTAPTLEGPRGVRGVARARVALGDPLAPSESVAEEAPSSVEGVVELRIRHPDGTPFLGGAFVQWVVGEQDGNARLTPLSQQPGVSRLTVPVGAAELVVAERGASGSLPPWTGRAAVPATGYVSVDVELPRGATARIERPLGWSGSWGVHASWRDDDGSPWQGSWNYSTLDDTLVLNALRSADWRFTLSRPDSRDADTLVRKVRLRKGDDVIVD